MKNFLTYSALVCAFSMVSLSFCANPSFVMHEGSVSSPGSLSNGSVDYDVQLDKHIYLPSGVTTISASTVDVNVTMLHDSSTFIANDNNGADNASIIEFNAAAGTTITVTAKKDGINFEPSKFNNQGIYVVTSGAGTVTFNTVGPRHHSSSSSSSSHHGFCH